ncbi:MAG: ABC transporter ATP-binding protein [Proteobacteria bacterium]|nr:ABC transporter ATP-binding protein [Pseudomonadota bacterium]
MLRTEGLVKSFGSLQAVDNVSISVSKGEVRAIIGPNGAGKTTLFNLITGMKADRGKVFFNGRDITNLPPHQIASLNVARAFQIISLFPKLTCFENLMCVLITRKKRNLNMFSRAKGYADIKEEVFRVLQTVGLAEKASVPASMLAHGDKKSLDIAIALACNAELMLLDEPTAGMSPEETQAITALISRVCNQKKITVVFTEHDMRVVFAISDNLTVLHQGRVIADGKPEEVRDNKEVIEAYLGEESNA